MAAITMGSYTLTIVATDINEYTAVQAYLTGIGIGLTTITFPGIATRHDDPKHNTVTLTSEPSTQNRTVW